MENITSGGITNRSSRPLIIMGAGGHAVSVANVALALGYQIKYFVDGAKAGQSLLGISILGEIEEIDSIGSLSFAVAVGDNAKRERIYLELIGRQPHLHFPPLIHPSAVVSFSSTVGDGTVVMPQAVVGPNSTVGRFCLLYTQASLDHDCSMLDYASLAPAAATGGTVQIGLRSAVSIGAVIKHGIKIGDDCVLGANSYLNADLAPNTVAYGTPAREIRTRSRGDAYL